MCNFIVVCLLLLIIMEWSQNVVLLLLEEYQKREILWKPRHPLFYNTIKKEDAWQEVAEIVNVEVQEIKKKIESLKGSFRREKSRIKKGTGTGKGLLVIPVNLCLNRNHF